MAALPSEPFMRQARRAVVSAAGFWLFYFLFWSLRSELLFQDHGRLLLPRLGAAAADAAITVPILVTLSWAASRRLGASILLAAVLAAPAGVAYALIDRAVFEEPATPQALAEQPSHRHHHGRRGDARGDDGDDSPTHALLERASNGYLLYLCAGLLRIALDYARSARALERRSAELHAAARLAEIRALRYQVNPHFLFNALNSLSALVLQGRTVQAEAMIDNLASFYRNALTQDPTGDVPLREELRLQRLYLEIESVRFPDRIRMDLDVPGELEDAHVPGLILQPLIENAVKHGVARSSAVVTISVLARAQGGRLLLRVSDDAAAERREQAEGAAPGLGLANVANRLAARYETAANCRWFDLGTRGFLVDLSMPLDPQKA